MQMIIFHIEQQTLLTKSFNNQNIALRCCLNAFQTTKGKPTSKCHLLVIKKDKLIMRI